MSVEFSNAYQEILLENVTAIIKQNFIFQTQIKLNQQVNQNYIELQKRYDTLAEELNTLKTQKTLQNDSVLQEKNRIQIALNEEMKKNSSLRKELEELYKVNQNEIDGLKRYISKLESTISPTKLAKVTKSKDDDRNDVGTGGTF